jgi:septal ring factor EnvC (AmiA/AmiB activator)
MVTFFKTILRLAFIGGVVLLFFAACSPHKNCGDTSAKKKYTGKRYNKALRERDSLCNLAQVQQSELTKQQTEIAALKTSYNDLNTRFDEYQRSSGSQLDKLNSDLGNKQAILRQSEARLQQLEKIL